MGIIDGWGMYVLLYGKWDECAILISSVLKNYNFVMLKKKKNFQHIGGLQIT